MSVFDPKWKYVHSTATDIRKTIAKARKALAKQQRCPARTPNLKLMPGQGASEPAVYKAAVAAHHDVIRTDATQHERLRLAPVQRGRRLPSW